MKRRIAWIAAGCLLMLAAVAYLRPALKRGNVTMVTRAHATRVLMQGTRATGIEYLRRGRLHRAHAGAEVILSGGVFNSPQLLMLSSLAACWSTRSLTSSQAPRPSRPHWHQRLQHCVPGLIVPHKPPADEFSYQVMNRYN